MGRLLAQPVEIGPVRFSNLALSAGWENGATVQAPVKTNCVPVSAAATDRGNWPQRSRPERWGDRGRK